MKDILEAYKAGELSLESALSALEDAHYVGNLAQDLGHSPRDLDRQRRNGAAEVIYGEHKTPALGFPK